MLHLTPFLFIKLKIVTAAKMAFSYTTAFGEPNMEIEYFTQKTIETSVGADFAAAAIFQPVRFSIAKKGIFSTFDFEKGP